MYTIRVTKQGFIPLLIKVDTEINAENLSLYEFRFQTEMRPSDKAESENINSDLLVGVLKYDKVKNRFYPIESNEASDEKTGTRLFRGELDQAAITATMMSLGRKRGDIASKEGEQGECGERAIHRRSLRKGQRVRQSSPAVGRWRASKISCAPATSCVIFGRLWRRVTVHREGHWCPELVEPCLLS